MKKYYLFFSVLLLVISIEAKSQINFDEYFIPKTLRVDYVHAGNATSSEVYLTQIKQEPFWGGSKKNLIDKFQYGQYLYFAYDSASNKLIYSNGFANLFYEWQSTDEAKTLKRSFVESITLPYPKKTVRIEIHRRDKKLQLHKEFELFVNPNDMFIKKDAPVLAKWHKILYSADPANALDLVFLAEGYTQNQMSKFLKDVERYKNVLLNYEPFKKFKDKINIWAVEAISQDSGTDVPGKQQWRNTVFNSSYYTFGVDRYLTTFDTKTIRDYAANVPYDYIMILVNANTYGGGGFYHLYTLSTVDHKASEPVFMHEFGHGFISLADEYYTSTVAFNDFYDPTVEPSEPNITTLVNFDKKWKNMLDKNTPIPTPATAEYKDKIGVFEGGGYSAKGIYRPVFNCLMKISNTVGIQFCPVCKRAIDEMMKFYTE